MIASRRLAPLPLLLAGLAVLTLVIALTVHAQSQEVTPTGGATGTNPPAKPTNLQVSAEHDSVTLTWTASTDQTVTHYAVLRRDRDTDAPGVFHVIESNAGPGTGYTDSSVSASTTYIYRVKSVSPTGVSQWSGYVKAETPAAPDPTPTPTLTPTPEPEPESTPVDQAPTNLAAALAEGGGVTLTWTAPSDDAEGVTGYEVLRAVGEGEMATLSADTGNTATAYTDATATQPGTSYAYRVKAIRGEERSQASGQARVQLPHDAVDLAPSDLAAAAVDGGGVSLTWTAPAEDAGSVTGYEVLRAVGEGDMATLAADTASTGTTYTDATATGEGETYAYQVKAIRGQARSRASNRASLVPVEPPATPENLKPTNLTFEIREDGVTLAWNAPAADAGSVTGYRVVRRRPNQGENEWLVWKWDTGSTETTYRDGYARTHGEYYMYRVRALRGDDYSKMSNRVDVRRPQATPQTAEWAPSNLQAQMYFEVALGEEGVTSQVKLTWDAPAEGVEWVRGYQVQRATCDGEFTALAADTGSTETAYADSTAEAGETYTYRVKARRPQGKSLWSGTGTILLPGGNGESDCAVPVEALPSQVQDPQTGLTPATLLNTLLGYDEAEGTGTLAPNELIFGEGATVRVTSVTSWPGVSGLVLYLTAGTSGLDAALADRDFILEADETVLVVGTTEFSFDDAALSHSDTTGDNGEYTGVVIVTWTEGEPGLVAGETVDFRLLLRNRPEEAQFTTHDTLLVKNTGQTADGTVNLTGSRPSNEYAQGFATGSSPGGYRLASISFDFDAIATPANAGGDLSVKLFEEGGLVHIDYPTVPGSPLCTLENPESFSASGVHTFQAPATCPALDPGSIYFAVIRRAASDSGAISLKVTTSTDEDSSSAADWAVRDSRTWMKSNGFWASPPSGSHLIEVSAGALTYVDQYPTNQYFYTLAAAGNEHPAGLWSDGATMWVADYDDSKIYAYDMATKAHVPDEDFDTLANSDHSPKGIWSDGTTMWVVQSWTSETSPTRVYAYDMTTKARVKGKEFPIPAEVSVEGFGGGSTTDARFQDIWSDGSGTMWIMSESRLSAYAYGIATGNPVPSEHLLVGSPYLQVPSGIWGDAQSIWLSDSYRTPGTLRAFWRFAKAAQPGRDIQLDTDNNIPIGLWSDGATMWVTDSQDHWIYAYPIPDTESPLKFKDRLTVERVTDTTAIVAVDLTDLPFNGERKHVSISINRAGYAIYARPDAKTARFMLRGLQPETQYTVSGKFDIQPSHPVGVKIFRTDYARLDGVEVSGLTHTEATVTVSLMHADVNKKAYPNLWVSGDRTEPDYTYYLRHRASEETEWSEPVELTFSGSTADVRLTALDPGTVYDVEVAETEDFMPPQGSAGSYQGTLTVGNDNGVSGIGFDQDGFFPASPSYGSIYPTTFELGGVDHSIVELRVGVRSFLIPLGDVGKLFLTFDKAPPDGAQFTLTLGTTEFESSDATVDGQTYSWAGGPSLTDGGSVTVELDFTGTVPFREGTTLEGAFSTPPLPQTLAFEAEMTVGTDSANAFDGFSGIAGSLSATTFEVGGVEYTVKQAGILTAAPASWVFLVDPALPFDSFTLTVGSTELQSSSASTADSTAGRQYLWSGTDPNWTSGTKVDVKLDVGLINICDRSPAVAHAIREATPSFDFCHMTSVLDLDDVTELDLPGGRGTGLKAGDFEGLSGLTHLDLSWYDLGGLRPQLPVGVFDGLDSLTHLDISHTGLMSLDLGVFESLSNLVELDLSDTHLQRGTVPVGVFDPLDNLEVLRLTNLGEHSENTFSNLDDYIFRGLFILRELDVGDSNPLRDSPLSLLPLTSLVTYNGQPYTRPADPPNLEYASGRIDHERGYSKTCYTVTLKWEAPPGVSGITGYRILRNLGAESLSRYAKQIATTGASARTFVDGRDADVCFGGVGSGPNVSYFVSAITAGGDSFPARVRVDQTRSFPTNQVPNTPTLRGSLYDLSVARSTNGYKVRLQWNDLHHNITGYEISFRGSSTAAWRTIAANAGNVLEYDLESVPVPPSSVPRTAENMYLYNAFRDQGDSIGFTDGREFRIRALNAAGNSGWSNVVRPFQ